jgi:hypothetical protein
MRNRLSLAAVGVFLALSAPAQGANIKGSQGHFEGDKLVDEPGSIVPPPGRLCIVGGEECIARDGWHLERDVAFGGHVAIEDGADAKTRQRNIDTDRVWLKLSDDERSSILAEENTIYDYFSFRYDQACHKRYGDGLRCRDTWKRQKKHAVAPSAQANVEPVRAVLRAVEENNRSMFIDVMVVTLLGMHASDPTMPPPGYDRYDGPVEIREDLNPRDTNSKIAGAWGWTEQPQHKGDVCIIHLAPAGELIVDGSGLELFEEVSRERIIRHELGHCAGLVHKIGADGQADITTWVRSRTQSKITASDRRPKTPRRTEPRPGPGPVWLGSW